MDIPFVLLGWISAFFTDQTQAVRVDLSERKQLSLRGRIPQGTKSGVIFYFWLFLAIINVNVGLS